MLKIFDVKVFAITSASAFIYWRTNYRASALVKYDNKRSWKDRNLVKLHCIKISNLEPGATYNFTCHSADGIDHVATSEQHSFKTLSNPDVTYFVATNGNDSNPGTFTQPFLTLDGARSAIRSLIAGGVPDGGIRVLIRGGVYQTLSTVAFTSLDIGTVDSPIVYEAYNNEDVQISGATSLTDWSTVTDTSILDRLPVGANGHVYQASVSNPGTLEIGGYYGDTLPSFSAELICNNEIMNVAQYPKKGDYILTDTIPGGVNGTTFTYTDTKGFTYASLTDVYAHGFFTYDWYDTFKKITDINESTKTVTIQANPSYGLTANRRFCFYNVLEELSVPGDYYIDRTSNIIYFWPFNVTDLNTCYLTTATEPLITFTNASHIYFKGITVTGGRSKGVAISGGNNIVFMNSTINNFGANNIESSGSLESGFVNCDIYGAGTCNVVSRSGDRVTLTPGYNFIVACTISDSGRRLKSANFGVMSHGCGNYIGYNSFFTMPHCAIFYGQQAETSNNLLIEYNTFDNILTDTSDAGAVYGGRDLSSAGNIIRDNYFSNILVPANVEFQFSSCIYFDDKQSYQVAMNNIFENCSIGIVVHGGHYNHLNYNYFIDSVIADMYFADSPLNLDQNSILLNNLNAMPYTSNDWKNQYPDMENVLIYCAYIMYMNNITHNVFSLPKTYFNIGHYNNIEILNMQT